MSSSLPQLRLLRGLAPALSLVLATAYAGLIHVAPDGDDGWSGGLRRPNATRTDGPLATLPEALRRSRAERAEGGDPTAVRIVLQQGTYRLREPLDVLPSDGGTAGAPVVIEGDNPEAPSVISAGVAVSDWEVSDGVWRARLPGVRDGAWVPRQLFVNGQRRPRARIPNKGFLYTKGPLWAEGADGKRRQSKYGFEYHAGDLEPWSDLGQAEFLVHHSWESSWHYVKELDQDNHLVRFTGPSRYPVGKWSGGRLRYLVENVRAACDAPGEWWVDRETGVLAYRPLPGETPTDTTIVAPRLTEAVRVLGDIEAGIWVEHVVFRNLSFRHVDWRLGPSGYTGPQAAPRIGQAIRLEAARSVVFENCEVTQCGTYAFRFGRGCAANCVEHCHLHDLGGGGVLIGLDIRSIQGLPESHAPREHAVHNNIMNGLGRVHPSGVGVWIAQAHHNQVTHNEICDLAYSALSVGWTWGYQPNYTHHNTVEWNHLHHVGRNVLSDLGAVYTLGISPGTRVCNNLIHHVYSYSYGGWGLYTDQASSGILFENNIVYWTKSGGFHQHWGLDNTLRNNIFAFSHEGQIRRSREEAEGSSFLFEGNIVLQKPGWPFLTRAWRNDHFRIDRNLYWDGTREPDTFAGNTLEEWQELGHDLHSVVADPGFVSPGGGDFSLPPGSPAAGIGFKPFDLSAAGVTGDSRWRAKATAIRESIRDLDVWAKAPAKVVEVLRSFDQGFEGLDVGAAPPGFVLRGAAGQATIAVTDESPATGARCLKLADSPGLAKPFYPYMHCRTRLRPGRYVHSFDIRLTEGAEAWTEWRSGGTRYRAGPSVRFRATGALQAGGRELARFPHGQWLHVDLHCELRDDGTGEYSLAVSEPGRPPQTFPGLPFVNPGIKRFEWLGFVSEADAATTFYLDNLKLGPAESATRQE